MTDISYSNVNDNTPVLVGNSQLTDKRGINGFNYLEILKEVSEEAILDCGAKPIITKINRTLNMDPKNLKEKITSKTKCIIPVHMLGVSAEIDEITKIADEHGIPVIEDNCEAIGAKFNDKFLGTISDIGVMSFDHGKMITTGEGGLILTNNSKLFKYSKEYHDHGHENNQEFPRGKDTRTIFGFNYRMTELQGAIGKVQISKLELMLKENEKRYKALENILDKKFNIRKIPYNSIPSYDTFILFETNSNKRKEIIKILNSEKFGTKNLPDAMEWHCSYFWNHALDSAQIKYSEDTKNLLDTAVAIPIWLRKEIIEYEDLAKKLILI